MNLFKTITFALCIGYFHGSYAQHNVLWKYSTNSAIHSSATISGDRLFFGSNDNHLYCLNKTSGELLWKYETRGAIQSTPAVANGKVYFNSCDGAIYSVHENNGKPAWIFRTNGEQRADMWDYYLSSPLVVNGVIYIGSGDSCVYALEEESGKCLWKYKTNGIVHATAACNNGVVYIGSFDGYFYALYADSGIPAWKFNTVGDMYFPLGEIQKGALIMGNTVVFGSRDYNIYALDATKGTGKWNMKEIGSWIIATPLVYDNCLYFGTSDSHRFYCMDAQTGNVIWTLPLNMRVYGSACVANGNIAFGCFNGKLYFVNPKTGKISYVFQTEESKLKYSTIYDANESFRPDFDLYGKETKQSEAKILALGSILSDPVVEGQIIYFGDSNGNFYALSLK